jgi:hypothetical protein
MPGRGAYQKKEQNVVNVRARHDLLINGIRAPTSVDKAVHVSLVGQRAFAALDLPKLNITPIALNTIKSLSDELFTATDGEGRKGFEYLNAMRVRLNDSIASVKATRTVEAKTERTANKTNQLTARLAAVELHGVKRQKAYLSLYSAINGLIKDGKLPQEAQMRIYRILDNHHAAFSDLFEPRLDSAIDIDPEVSNMLKQLNKSK